MACSLRWSKSRRCANWTSSPACTSFRSSSFPRWRKGCDVPPPTGYPDSWEILHRELPLLEEIGRCGLKPPDRARALRGGSGPHAFVGGARRSSLGREIGSLSQGPIRILSL